MSILTILNGGNFSTECIREPLEWHYHASDLRQIKDIHSKFGTLKLVKFPTADIFKYKIYYRFFKGMKVIQPLNFVKYIKSEAVDLLEKRFDWKQYSHKHYESRFTKFYEGFCTKKFTIILVFFFLFFFFFSFFFPRYIV